MPVPNAIAPDETPTVTSWDAFKLPVDIEEVDEKEPTFSMPVEAPDFMDGPLDRNRSPLARTIKDAPRVVRDTPKPVVPDAPKPPPPRQEHKEPSFGPQPEADDEEFSMSITLDGDSVPNNTPADPDFDKPATTAGTPDKVEPYRSEIARQLGIPAYAPEGEHSTVDQTVMLEEPVEIVPTTLGNGPESLFDEHERQERQKDGKDGKGIEDRRHKRSGGVFWMLGSLGMLAVFGLLASYLGRTELARSVPTLRPTLESACSWIGCTVPFPQDADQIVLQGHSFNPEPGQDGKYRLIVTLNNKAAYGQAWPNIELTVTDRFDIAVARRVIKPTEWLPSGYANLPAFDAHSEVTANLPISLDNVQAAGYRLYVFYP